MKKPIYFKPCFSLFLLILMLGWNTASQAQIIQNGSFEDYDSSARSPNGFFTPTANQMTSWVNDTRVHIHHRTHHAYGGHLDQHVDLNDSGVIEQTLDHLAAGRIYTVQFIRRLHNGEQGDGASLATADVDIISGGTTIANFPISLDASVPQDLTWVTETFQFTATGPTAIIRFSGTGSDLGWWGGVMIDDVQVIPPVCYTLLEIDTVGCDEFEFSVWSPISIHTRVWYLNGVITDLANGPIHLDGGSYEICFGYLGFDSTQDSILCCDRICITLDVVGIDTTYRTDSTCALTGGTYPYEPCQEGDYSFYSIDNISPDIEPCSEAGIHYLPPGNHVIRHYDEDTCLRWVEYLNILLQAPDTTTCYKRIVKCLFPVDPMSVLPTPPYCLDCYDQNRSADFAVEAPMLINVNTAAATETYERRILDLVNCKICIFTFDIVDSVCNFTPNYTPIPLGNGNYQFTPTSLSNACGNANWSIMNMNTGTLIYSTTQPAFMSLNYNFPPVPGTYRITMDVCVCVCNDTCCKSVFYDLVISPPPALSVIKNPATGEQYTLKPSNDVLNPQENERIPNTDEVLPSLPTDGTGIRLVPNPTSSEFKIIIDGIDASVYDLVQIISADGKIVDSYQAMKADHIYQLHVASGAYTVKVSVKEQVFNTKLVIQP